ncbi:hypothetical protein D047_4897B, partial [Vibrio parahaemolyticus VPTS-2010_2]
NNIDPNLAKIALKLWQDIFIHERVKNDKTFLPKTL